MTRLNPAWSAVITLLFLVPTFMLASCAPKRDHFGFRVVLSVAASLLVFGSIDTVIMSSPATTLLDLRTYLPGVLGFGAGVVALIAVSYACFDMSIWVAAFCGTAGYIIQNLGDSLSALLSAVLPPATWSLGPFGPYDIIGILVVYVAVYLLLVRSVRRNGLTGVENRRTLTMVVVVIFVNVVASLTLGSLESLGMPVQGTVILRALHVTTCILMLYLEYEMLYHRRILREIEATQHVLEERSRQYELSRGNIDAINVKCHDIRHQIRALADGSGQAVDPAVLADIEREVNVYDSMVKTGNDALDTILTEKSLVCGTESIALSCIADGRVLGFMAPTDIYAFFGNVLDNAIEAEREVENHNDRSISLVVRENAGMASIHVDNYFTGSLEFVDGLPQTTKDDKAYHGFGTKSMRLIVERYGGTLSMGTEGSTFFVNALIPLG